MKYIKEKVTSISGSLSGALSFLGSYQVCHAVCLWIITILSLLGITIVGMPLIFLQKVAVPFWSLAVILLAFSFIVYIKKKCLSKKLLILNTGLIVAGMPFSQLQDYSKYFMLVGGILVLISLILFIKDKLQGRKKWQIR